MKQQEMVEIKLHSVIDLITNSSTEIFVKSENSLEPCKELINELLKVWEPGKTWEDIFDIDIKLSQDSIDCLLDYIDEDEEDDLTRLFANELNETKRQELKRQYIKDIYNEDQPEPGWWDDVSAKFHIETYLVLTPKELKYERIGELLLKFLYSTDNYEHDWG